VFIGDGGDEELVGARRVGMRTVLVDRGLPHSTRARAAAAHVVASLADVLGEIQVFCRRKE
jgi:putative hydrolase of the HAD superfamily